MCPPPALPLLKALADPTRLRLVRALLEAPCYVEELATKLNLAPATVSHHLKRLEGATLVAKTKEQYYVVYRLRPEVLEPTLRDLVASAGPDAGVPAADQRMDAYRQRILGTFVADGRVPRLPAQHKKRLVVLAALVADLQPGRDYTEDEVNAVFVRRYPDYCTVRRELVDARLLSRDGSGADVRYRRCGEVEVGPLPAPGPPTQETPMPPNLEERKRRVALYKQARRRAGIYGIRNRETGRLLVGSSLNLHGPLNRHRAELGFGSHRCRALQDDWNALGAEAFEFEVLDTVDEKLEGLKRDAALRAMEQDWIAHLQPFADKCYNGSEQIRTKAF